MVTTFLILTAILGTAMVLITSLLFLRIKGYGLAKFAVSVGLVVLASWIAFSYKSVLGFPTFDHLPPLSRLMAVEIRENPKRIFVWLSNDLDEEPRAYRVEATEKNEQMMKEAQKRLKKGGTVMLKSEQGGDVDTDAQGQGVEGSKGEGVGQRNKSYSRNPFEPRGDQLSLQELPDLYPLPPK